MNVPVFIAANMTEIDDAESLLATEDIRYEVRTEHALDRRDGVCLMGMLFEVDSKEADRVRRLFIDRGLARGVVTMECN